MRRSGPGIVVTDDSLVQCIGEIRKALGDDAASWSRRSRAAATGWSRCRRPARPAAAREARRSLRRRRSSSWRSAIGAWQTIGAEEAPSQHAGRWRCCRSTAWRARTEALSRTGRRRGRHLDAGALARRGGDRARLVLRLRRRAPRRARDRRGAGASTTCSRAASGARATTRASSRSSRTRRPASTSGPSASTGPGRTPGRWSTRCRAGSSLALAGEKGEIKRAQFREAWGKDSASPRRVRLFPARARRLHERRDAGGERARRGRSGPRGWSAIPDSALLKVKLGWSHWTAAWYYWSGDLAAHFREADRLVSEVLAGTTCRRRCSGRRIG